MESAVVKGSGGSATKLQGRDFILIAVFGVLFFVVMLAFSLVFSMSAHTMWFTHSVGAIPSGIIWMYLFSRVPKRGAIFIMGVLIGLLGFLMGMFWTGPLGIVVGSIIGELIMGIGGKRTPTKLIIAFAAFVLCFWIGQISLIYLAGQSYVDMVVGSGMSLEYAQQLVDFVYGPLVFVAFCTTIIGSLIGGFLGKKLFKKHFEKIVS